MKPPHISIFSRHKQRGAALMIMLIVLVLGITAALVSSLSRVSLQTSLNDKNNDLLAKAKEVVIGYAVNGSGGSQRPGDLIRPDVANESPTKDYDGTSDGCLDVTKSDGSTTTDIANVRCLGRLPWKDYGLAIESPSQNDPTGFMPWYAVSSNLMDPNTVAVKLNSEILNDPPPHPWLTVRDLSGNVLSDRVVFLLIIPGPPVNGQSRASSPLAGANQYLDSITVPVGCTAPCVPGTYSNADMDDSFIMGDRHRWIDDPDNPGKQIEDTSYNFNDRLIYVTIDELMPLIEKRITREVKKCLDDYADTPIAAPSHKYPWPAKISDDTVVSGTRFGRVPSQPTITTPYTPASANEVAMFSALTALQTAVNNCAANNNSTNRNALDNAGQTLENIAKTVRNANLPSSSPMYIFANAAKTAGSKAQDSGRCSDINNDPINNTVQDRIDTANTKRGNLPETQEDPSMSSTWPSGCFVSGTYWDAWKNLVFYQVDDKYKPNGTVAACNSDCLSISGNGNINSGSGNYRAVVTLAGKINNGLPRNSALIEHYLEGANLAGKSDVPDTTTFETYKSSDPSYQNINDLVMCVDSKVNCK